MEIFFFGLILEMVDHCDLGRSELEEELNRDTGGEVACHGHGHQINVLIEWGVRMYVGWGDYLFSGLGRTHYL